MKHMFTATGLALLGLVVAVAVTLAASNLSSQPIGISAEPTTAGEQLAVPERRRSTTTARPKRVATRRERAPLPARTSPAQRAPLPAPPPPPVDDTARAPARGNTPSRDDDRSGRDDSGGGSEDRGGRSGSSGRGSGGGSGDDD